MTGAKGSNASKASLKPAAPARQQSLFQFYKKQSKPSKESQNTQNSTEVSSVQAVPPEPSVAPETRSVPPKEGVGVCLTDLEAPSSKSLEPSKRPQPKLEKRGLEETPNSLDISNNKPGGGTQISIGPERTGAHQPLSRSETASAAPQQKVDALVVGEALSLLGKHGAGSSTTLPKRRTYPIFDKHLPDPSSQSSVSCSQAISSIPRPESQSKKGRTGPAFHDVVDLTESIATKSTSSHHSIIIIDDDSLPRGPSKGSQDAPIDLSSSPPAQIQPAKTLHPFFAPRAGQQKRDDPSRHRSTGSPSRQLEVPWPDGEAQHNRGPQSCFWTSTSSPFGKFRGSSPPAWFSSQPNLRFLDSYAVTRALFSEGQAGPSKFHAPTLVERKDIITSLPSSHRKIPGILRLLDDEDVKVKPHHLGDYGELWTHKWRPRQAVEVLGNEDNARYLKAWLHALEIREGDNLQTANNDTKAKSEVRSGARGTKRPTVVRAVAKKRGRKRRRVESDDGSSLGEWIVGDEDEEEMDSDGNSDQELFLRATSPRSQRGSLPPSPHTRGPDAMANDNPSSFRNGSNHQISHLTNTILLAGPPGSGKTSTVYACAEELGWEVFEVYPGIGKRSGGNISSLVGDVGKNHLVGRGGASRTNGQGSSIQPFQPGFGYLSGEGHSDVSGTEDGTRAIRQSIILLEEVDILFKEDANFWPTVVNIIKSSRRPIFMTCNDISLVPRDDLPLQTCLLFRPCPSPLAVSFLQCVCLAEGHLVPRDQLEAIYARTYKPISSDEPDEPKIPYPSQPRPCSDLRHALNDLQFWCQWDDNEATGSLKNAPEITTTSWSEVLADWSHPSDALRGSSPEKTTPHEHEIDRIWKHSECASYVDGYLERRSSDVLEALSIDRHGPSADDEIGYTMLDKSSTGRCSSGLVFYSRDEDIAREALETSRHVLETSGAGPRVRGSLRGNERGTALDSRSLMWGRVANQTGVVSFLDDLISLSAPLLPRPAAVLEYTAYVRQMILADDALEAEASAVSETQTRSKRGRNTRNGGWRLGEYPRYIAVSPEGLDAARKTVLA